MGANPTPQELADRLEALAAERCKPTRNPWTVAWEAAELVASLDDSDHKRVLAAGVLALRVAETCERRLNAQDLSSIDDGGTTAADRIRKYLLYAAEGALTDLPAPSTLA